MQTIKIIIASMLSIVIVGVVFCSPVNSNEMDANIQIKVNVWDTYVTKKNNEVMHFDIIAPIEVVDPEIIYKYGKEYLKTKGQEGQPLTAKQCRLCHMESLRPQWEAEIADKGYFIIEMEGCD